MAFDRCYWLPALKVAVALGTLAGTSEMSATAARADWARPAPWCANLGGRDGGWDCGYYTFDQCMATARGLGGSCAPNPRALARRRRRRAACGDSQGTHVTSVTPATGSSVCATPGCSPWLARTSSGVRRGESLEDGAAAGKPRLRDAGEMEGIIARLPEQRVDIGATDDGKGA